MSLGGSLEVSDTEVVEAFAERLQVCVAHPIRLTINDNRSTMMSISWTQGIARVSLHRMFLAASREVLFALARYIRGEVKGVPLIVKQFIGGNLPRFDYSHELKGRRLVSRGVVYDLQALYEELNEYYFATPLDLKITWYGERYHTRKNRINLGLYYDALKLIKIHRLLDNAHVPRYVIKFVIYHEMLHAVCQSYIDQKGWVRAHGQNFTSREEQFQHYALAKNWLRRHQMHFFSHTR